jgi:hypothetical protein
VIHLSNQGVTLVEKGRFNEAAAISRKAVALGVESDRVAGLVLLLTSGQADALIALCQRTIAAQPEDALAYLGLGWGLTGQGRFREAWAALRRGHQLSAKRPSLAAPSERWLRDFERMKEQDSQLAAYVAEARKPKGRDELRTLVYVCVIRKRPLLAARLHTDALTADPAWADDPHAEAHYDAARFAALAAAGKGEDAAGLNEAERARWRRQARQWLEVELARTAKYVASATPLDQGIALDRLRWWQQEPDLSVFRDKEALANLPADEQEACRKLWAAVVELLSKVQKRE